MNVIALVGLQIQEGQSLKNPNIRYFKDAVDFRLDNMTTDIHFSLGESSRIFLDVFFKKRCPLNFKIKKKPFSK